MSEITICPRCQTPLPAGTTPAQCPRCLLRLGFDTNFESADQPVRAKRPPPTPLELAGEFPQLEILELLGQGGMGIVYKARQRSLDRLVALKILTVDAEAESSFAERFAREARALAALDHASIVRVYDSGQVGARFYLVMEYVDGTDVRRMLRASRVAPREGLAIVAQVCDALQYAHDQGIVHRDIKPENILVDRRGRVKIADFGLAKLVGRAGDAFALTGTNQAMGTPHYMAPEQIEHPQDVDHRADIYSLGVVLYELLTGELPLGRFVPPSRKVEIDVRLDEVVLKALEKDPPRRYQHASEVRSGIDNATSASATPAAQPSRSENGATNGDERLRRQRKVFAWIAGCALLVAVGVPLFLWLSSGDLLSSASRSTPLALLIGPWLLLAVVAAGLFLVSLMRRPHTPGHARSAWPWVFGCGGLLFFGGLLAFAMLAALFIGPSPATSAAPTVRVESGAPTETRSLGH